MLYSEIIAALLLWADPAAQKVRQTFTLTVQLAVFIAVCATIRYWSSQHSFLHIDFNIILSRVMAQVVSHQPLIPEAGFSPTSMWNFW